jgi:hypothetical protein
MFVLTTKGQLVEGEPLTLEEKTLVEDVLKGTGINADGVYLTETERKAVVVYLVKNFCVTYRNLPAVIQKYGEAEAIDAEFIDAPAVALDENA